MPSLSNSNSAADNTALCLVPAAIKERPNTRLERNRRLPILRIYPDILELIFILGVNPEHTIYKRQHTVISYSQTCHDWRIVTISIKSLWSDLVDFELNSEAWNKELLRRSYPFPIVVKAYTTRRPSAIDAELAHLERIRIYRVGFEASAWDILVERLQQPAPHIEYLDIIHAGRSSNDSFILPSTLFAADAPHFKRLDMTQCLVDFQAPVLRSLTTLSVEYPNASIAPTPSEWLEHLSRLPSLTSLRLKNSMRSQGHSAFSISAPETNQVQLSLLSALDLDASLDNISVLISGLKFPAFCGLIINCSKCYPGPELEIVLSAYLYRLDYAHHLLPENCPFLIYARRSTISIRNEQSLFDPSSDEFYTDIPPTLRLDLHSGNFELWESLLTPVLYRLREAFSKFTSLEVQLPPTIYSELLPCLVRATKLTQLTKVSATMTKKLLSQIQIIQPSDVIPLPALHTIVFIDDESMWGVPYQTFVSFLRWRRSVGHPITRVLFRQCMVLYDTVIGLGVHDVQVDCDSAGSRWQRL